MSQRVTIFDKLASIGCQFADTHLISVDIEDTLAEAIETLPYSPDKGRLLKVLCSWILENGDQVILEKLGKILTKKAAAGADVSYAAFLGAFATSNKIHKWSLLKKFEPQKEVLISDKNHGQNPVNWAQEVNFFLATDALKTDAKYTLSRAQLAKMHKQYRNRLIYGAQYRADIVTATQLGLTRVKDIVRLIGVSPEPVSRILADLRDAGILQSRTLPAMSHEGYLEDSHTLRPDR
jgi:hypothetical protein